MVSVYRGRTATVRVLSPCGYGTQIPCPHHMYGCRVVMVYRHRANNMPTVAVRPRYMDTVPTWYRYRGHTATVHNVVARCPCTMSTQQLYIPCGHSVRVPWPHGDHTYCLGTDTVATRYTNIVPTRCLRSPCGHGIWTPCPHGVYRHRVATVHRYRAHTTCMVGVCPWYTDTVPTLCLLSPCSHGTRTPCSLGIDTVATRRPYILSGHGHRAHTVCTVAMWLQYTDTVPKPHMVAVWPWYTNTVPTPCLRLPCGHSTRTLCPLGIDTMATRRPYTTGWHGGRCAPK